MKNKFLKVILFWLLLVTGLILSGCDNGNKCSEDQQCIGKYKMDGNLDTADSAYRNCGCLSSRGNMFFTVTCDCEK